MVLHTLVILIIMNLCAVHEMSQLNHCVAHSMHTVHVPTVPVCGAPAKAYSNAASTLMESNAEVSMKDNPFLSEIQCIKLYTMQF